MNPNAFNKLYLLKKTKHFRIQQNVIFCIFQDFNEHNNYNF